MILYIPYISYIFRIFAKKGNYGSNSYTSKKDIDLKEDTFKALSVMAARQGQT